MPVLRTGAARLADAGSLPTAVRALAGYYADSGVLDVGALSTKRRVDDRSEAMIGDAFGAVADAVAAEFDVADASFDYGTKLVMPAELTLGYIYRTLDDPGEHERAEALTQLIVDALIEGDMRDAINDEEYEDFAYEPAHLDAAAVARVARDALRERVERQFDRFPDAREPYDWAVEYSERHQDRDERFRSLMAAAGDGDPDARERIEREYKFADFPDDPDLFSADERDLPYVKTQYARVGVIYDGMIDMYRAEGFDVDQRFKASIVLAIIAAQVWLDDIDDYAADRENGQLTPVTAEYLLADDERAAYDAVVDLTDRYLDRAKRHATATDSPLTGIAAEYIYRSGDPSVLPGAPE